MNSEPSNSSEKACKKVVRLKIVMRLLLKGRNEKKKKRSPPTFAGTWEMRTGVFSFHERDSRSKQEKVCRTGLGMLRKLSHPMSASIPGSLYFQVTRCAGPVRV